MRETGGFRSITVLVCAGLASSLLASSAFAQRDGLPAPQLVETFGHSGYAPTPPKPQAPTYSELFNLPIDIVPVAGLGPIDVNPLIMEDEQIQQQMGKAPLRVSVSRNLVVGLPSGDWTDVPGGRVWRARVVLQDAMSMRLHLWSVNIPEGAELAVSSVEEPSQQIFRFVRRGLNDSGECWTPAVIGSQALLEYFVPAGVDGNDPQAIPFLIDEAQHVYRDLFHREGGIAGGAGACHNQPACFAAWTDVRKAIGQLFFVDGSGFVCSGQLIATTTNDQTPYLLTANHCISNATVAATCQVTWKFEAVSCGGGISGGTVSTPCSFVTSYPTADSTLLMVDGALPTNMFWAGWSNNEPASGTAATCLHHPAGDYMRISFGTEFNTPNCGGTGTNFVRADWSSGVTEGGSSGSGFFRNDTQQLFGTLTCGGSSCAAPTADDSYGQFDRAYNVGGYSGFLGAGSDDGLEQNDACISALSLAPGTYNNLIVKSTDEDWYRLSVAGGGSINANASFTHSNGDVELQLYATCGGTLLASSVTNNNSEVINYVNPGAATDVFLRVFIDTDTRNGYNLVITVPAPANNNCASGTIVAAGTHNFTTVAATTDGPDEGAACLSGGFSHIQNDVWFRYLAQCTGTAKISTCGATFDTKIAVYGSACPAGPGSTLACSDTGPCGTAAEVTFPVTSGQVYRVRIGSPTGTTGTGQMVITCTVPVSCPADIAGGDNIVNVGDLLAVIAAWGPCADINNCPADIAPPGGDDLVNVGDLLAVIAAWGPCP